MSNRKSHKIVDLEGLVPLARGSRRSIFAQEDFWPASILKVQDDRAEMRRVRPVKRALRRLAPGSIHRMLWSEATHQMKLHLRAGDDAPRLPLPEFRGLVQTTSGTASVWQAIRGADGALAPNLYDCIARDGAGDYVDDLNHLVERLFAFGAVVTDLNLRNIAVSERDGGRDLYVVDGFGDPNWIPVKSILRPLRERRLSRACRRMCKQTELVWDPDTRRFDVA